MTDLSNSSNDLSFVDSGCSLKDSGCSCSKRLQTLEQNQMDLDNENKNFIDGMGQLSSCLDKIWMIPIEKELRERLLSTFTKLQKDGEDLIKRNEKLNIENTRLIIQSKLTDSKMNKFKEENNSNLTELAKLREDYKGLENELKSKKNLIDQLHDEENELIKEIEKLQNLRIDNILLKNERDRLHDLSNLQRTEINELNDEKEELKTKNKKLKEECDYSYNESLDLFVRKEELEAENKELNEECDQLYAESKNLRTEINDLITQKEIFEVANKELNEYCEKLVAERQDKEELEAENRELNEECDQLYAERQNALENSSIFTSLSCDYGAILNFINKRVFFIPFPNKITKTCHLQKCCGLDCLKSDLSNGYCFNNNGFVNVDDENGLLKYKMVEERGRNGNNFIGLYAKNEFTKALSFRFGYSLFYFEATLRKEATKHSQTYFAAIGFGGDSDTILLNNGPQNYTIYSQKFSWRDFDVFGCGIIFPPVREHERPYIFFTKNGKRIGDIIILTKNAANYCPFIGLKCCSAKINFGNDLEARPFIYNVYNHTL